MAFSEQFLEDLRARSGLADIIGRRVKLARKGREHLGLCPFHKEKTPSFTVNEDKGFYHCFGCEAHGSVFDFVMETEGLTFPQAVEKLAGEAGLEVPRDTPEERERQRRRQTLYDVTEKAAVFFERSLRMPGGKAALDYLKRRGLDDGVIQRFRLGFAPDGRAILKGALGRDGVSEDLMVAAGLVIRPDEQEARMDEARTGTERQEARTGEARTGTERQEAPGVRGRPPETESGEARTGTERQEAPGVRGRPPETESGEARTGTERQEAPGGSGVSPGNKEQVRGYPPEKESDVLVHEVGGGQAGPKAQARTGSEKPRRAPYDRFRGRVTFPITDAQGRVIAFGGRILGDGEPKYLNSPETPLFQKGRVLYGLKLASGPARKAGTIIVTEGYMDVIALNRAGIENAVAPLGTALTEDQIRLLWRIVPEPVVCFDGDDAGQKAAARAAERALPLVQSGYGLRFAMLPAGEDPDTLIRSGGPDAIAQVVARALPLSEVLWRMETGGRLPKTPEERGAVQKRLRDYARQITDSTLRAHFLSQFNDRIWKGSGTRGRKPGWTPSMHLDEGAPSTSRVTALQRAERVLLAIIINHPDIFDGVEETLGGFSFSEERLDQLRQELISVLLKHADMESDGVKGVLRERGFAESLDVLLQDPLIRDNRHINADASPEDCQPLWNENVELLKHLESAPEVEKIREHGQDGIDDEDWEKTRALIEQTMPGHRE